jgi:hypothetical protein
MYISIRIKNVVKIMCLIEICRLSEESVECDGIVEQCTPPSVHQQYTSSGGQLNIASLAAWVIF